VAAALAVAATALAQDQTPSVRPVVAGVVWLNADFQRKLEVGPGSVVQ
jgi:hypothetical protein